MAKLFLVTLLACLAVGPSFSRTTPDTTTRIAWPAAASTNSIPSAVAGATAQYTTRSTQACDLIAWSTCTAPTSENNICSAGKTYIQCIVDSVGPNCPDAVKTAAQQAIDTFNQTLSSQGCGGSTQACGVTAFSKCTAPTSENNICSYLKCIEDGTSDCPDVIKNAAQAALDTIKKTFPGQNCGGGGFVNVTTTPFTTPAVVTPSVSEPDALASEWSTLTSCSFKETTETCAREKYTLEFSRALHFEVCRNAYIFLECLEDRCQYSKELTRSIMKTRADCSAASKKLSQSNVVINNYIGGKAESRRAKSILEILGIYPDN